MFTIAKTINNLITVIVLSLAKSQVGELQDTDFNQTFQQHRKENYRTISCAY